MTQSNMQLNIIKELGLNIRLSIPLIIGWLVYAVSGFVATVMVARLGETALAASVVISGVWVVINVFYYGIFNAVTVLVSHQFGAGNNAAVGSIVRNAFVMALLFCIPTMLIIAITPFFLRWIVPTQEVLILATSYAHTLMWATPGMIALVVFENLLNGIGKTKYSLWISLCEVPIEILLIYIFVFGKFGMPAFGVAGVGYGFTASYTLTMLGVIIYLATAEFARPFNLFKLSGFFEKRYFRELVRIGMPIGFMYLIEVSAFTTATFLMARFGTLALAAQQITMQFLGVTVNIPYAMGQAVSIRIGQNAGRLDMNAVRISTYVGMAMSFIFMLFVSSAYFFFPHILLRLDVDTSNPVYFSLIKQAMVFLSILALFQLFDSVRVIAVSTLRALKDTRFPMYISLISFWGIGLVCAFMLALYFHLNGAGIWMGLAIGVSAGAVILLLRLRYILNSVDLAEIINI
jgi:MATE family multidrug resistance protein